MFVIYVCKNPRNIIIIYLVFKNKKMPQNFYTTTKLIGELNKIIARIKTSK